MRKITNFIVEKRNYILIIFIILSFVSLYIGIKVPVNKDISVYLPENSETKIGMNIMNDNFDKVKQSQLYIMFKDLSKEEKTKMKEELSNIKNVSSVDYDDTDKYNNEEYSLYIINVDDYSNSKTSKELYEYVKETYKDKGVSLGGSIDEENKPIVQNWILISAVVFAMIILIIMCESYVEPFLFLFVIGLAIFLNSGTNIIFDSVSNITSAISAILQLALSMDYSIILMNRYSQEKEKYKDNKKAMKEALYNASKSIASSSVTTIVGLLALVFMSFTIGKDLGFVLAKGVLFSLISIFLCLPGLILLFDKKIEQTKKKSVKLNLTKLGKLSYKYRYASLIIFVLLLGFSFYSKGNLGYLYTGAEQDEIAKHFKTNNEMAIIYNNEYEDIVGNYCRSLENDKVDNILCYGNTIGENLKYNEINNKLETLNTNTNVDEYLSKIIYYYYYNPEINNKMTFNEFISFIENYIYTNDKLSSNISNDMKDSITKLSYFTDNIQINRSRTIEDIANILDIPKEQVQMLYVLYHSKDVDIKINISDFINFLNNDVIYNEEYGNRIDKDTIESIKTLSNFTNTNTIKENVNAKVLASLLGIDENSVKSLLMLYYSNVDSGYKVSLSDFIIGIDLSRDYLKDIDLSSLEPLIKIAKNENNINGTKLSSEYLKLYFKGYEFLVDLVYKYENLPSDYLMTPQELVNTVIRDFSSLIPSSELNKLNLVSMVIDDTLTLDKTLYSYNEMAQIIGLDENSMLALYGVVGNTYGYEYKLSPYELVSFILSNKDNPLLSSSIDEFTFNKLNILKTVMDAVLNNTSYSYQDLSSIFKMNYNSMSLLYSLYDINYINKDYTISLNNFVKYILSDVITNPEYKDSFDEDSINKLQSINEIMDATINNTKYLSNDLYNILSNLDNNLNKNLVDLVYIYYGSVNNYDNSYEMTLEKFIYYLNDNIINNDLFIDFIDNDMKDEIINAKDKIMDAKEMLVGDGYSRAIINTIFDKESDETFKFIQSVKDNLNSKDKEIYLIGDSPMAYDMDGSFGSELDFITVLTMVAIFVVVAFTFKSVIIPLILVLIIQCSVFIIMSILSFSGSGIYFIAILIVQSILMGATIDYAIVFTSYYKEYRLKDMTITDALINSYNSSIHTILTSASILIIVTFIVGCFAEAIAAKICMTISKGTFCSVVLILFLLPGMLACMDKYIIKNKTINN